MHSFEDLEPLQALLAQWRRQQLVIGFVPTMGNLHDGHRALVELAGREADRVVASVFVNPAQFGDGEDFQRYPRTPDADGSLLAAAGCDALFVPRVETMYPFGMHDCVRLHVPRITSVLEGAHRPGHFDGVATVVARLFNMLRPDLAVFGRKDYQQLRVIHHLVRDLGYAIRILEAPTCRATDGLALSSRNQYLDAAQRARAAAIPQTLLWLRDQAAAGGPPGPLETAATARLQAAGFDVDYVAIRRPDLEEVGDCGEPGLVALVAARLGATRLIDNLALDEG